MPATFIAKQKLLSYIPATQLLNSIPFHIILLWSVFMDQNKNMDESVLLEAKPEGLYLDQ